MRKPKIFHHNDVLEITSRTAFGLPFTAAPFVRLILEGLLARAQELYPVTISHYTFMANHFHMILVVEDPQDVPNFLHYFKCRSAHIFNKILDRQGQFWTARYDSPVILNSDTLTKRLVYHYTNPQRAGLIDTIESYPHLSTWKLLEDVNAIHTKTCEVVSLERVSPIIANRTLKAQQLKFYEQKMREAAWCKAQLQVEPAAAYRALGCDELEIDQHILNLKELVQEEEQRLRAERKKSKKKVMGAHKLVHDRLLKDYTPRKRGRKMICLCSCRKLRTEYIKAFQACVERLRDVYDQWKKGNFIDYPIYAFPPGRPVTVVPITRFAEEA